MVLGFKNQFVDAIKNGTKLHSIREDKHGRWNIGRTIHMATGVRTTLYNQFDTGMCISIQKIEIVWHECIDPGEGKLFEVYVDGKVLNLAQLLQLSKNDGFKSLSHFKEWFNKDFIGKIIHWTDLRY